jgi:hypothetical protein
VKQKLYKTFDEYRQENKEKHIVKGKEVSKHGKACPFQSANILNNSVCQHYQRFNYRRYRTVSCSGDRQYSIGSNRHIPAEQKSESAVLTAFLECSDIIAL